VQQNSPSDHIPVVECQRDNVEDRSVAESDRDGRPSTDDSLTEAMDEETPGLAGNYVAAFFASVWRTPHS